MNSPNSLSFWQRFFKFISSKGTFEEIEKESRSWLAQCSNCKYERSIWEMGGIRWKATGNPKIYHKCPNCGQRNWHRIYRMAQ